MIRHCISAAALAAVAFFAWPSTAGAQASTARVASIDDYRNDERSDDRRDERREERRDERDRRGDEYGQRYAQDVVVRCESIDEHRTFCRTDRSRRVELVSRISNASCIRNRSWGSNAHGIWVDRGCRADFRVSR